jgi:hypothetical protein
MTPSTTPPRLFTFAAGASGPGQIDSGRPVTGESMPAALRLAPGDCRGH